MLLRRVFVITVSAFIIAASAFSGAALAADGSVTVSNIRVSPSALPDSGQVSVTVNVAVDASRAEGGITNVIIDGDGVVKPEPVTDEIQAAANQDVGCTLNVQAGQLGADIPLTVKWDGGSLPFSVHIGSSAPAVPQVSFTRSVDSTTVEKGGTVTLVYRVQNTGSIDITNLSITDGGIGSDALRTKDALPAGDTYEFSYSHVVNADFTSTPKLTYTANGAPYSAACPARTVTMKEAQLDVLLEAAPATVESGGKALLQCTVTNSGNVRLSGITIGDNTLGAKLFPVFSLDAGAPSKYFSWDVSLTKTTKFRFALAAKDDEGNAYNFQSNEIEVVVTAGGKYDVGFSASADAIRLAEPGEVTFRFTVSNSGNEPLTGASILDQDGAVIKAFDALPVGETSYSYPAVVDKTRQYQFSLVIPNGDGTSYQAAAEPMRIEVAEPTTAPPGTLNPTSEPSPGGTEAAASAGSGGVGKMGSLIAALLIVGVLIAVTIIVLIAMIVSDRKKHRK